MPPYQKTFRTDCISKKAKVNRGEVTRYLISNNHLAIIDRDTFNLVQAELARRNNKRKKPILPLPSRESTARNMPLQSCLCAGLAVVLFAEPLKAPKARLLTIGDV